MDEARGEFSSLLQQFPEDDDLRFSLALVCLEAEAWREAIVYLEELIQRDAHVDPAQYNLGRAHEALGEVDDALLAYSMVGGGTDYLPAQARMTDLLVANGRSAEASRHLAEARDEPEYALQLYLIEAESLSKQNKADQAWNLIQQALKQYPGDINLLYTLSLIHI